MQTILSLTTIFLCIFPLRSLIPCSSDLDCYNIIYPLCQSGTCTQPTSSSDCQTRIPGSYMETGPGYNFCYFPCSGMGSCSQFFGLCQGSDYCYCCSSDTQCSTEYNPGIRCLYPSQDCRPCGNCETATECTVGLGCVDFHCATCNSEAHCTDPRSPKCSSNTCKCLVDSDCGVAPHLRCVNSRCHECGDHPHCTSAQASRCNGNVCEGCLVDTECDHISGKPICDGNGECVECVQDSDCSGSERCKTDESICVECLSHTDCTDTAASVCNNLNVCEICEEDSPDCDHLPSTSHCQSGTGCVECNQQQHCQDEALSACGQSYTCEACEEDSDCNHIDGKAVCDSVEGCVECTTNTHCPDFANSKCQANTCQPCEVDNDCDHISGKQVCSSQGECVECVENTDCGEPNLSKCNIYQCQGCVGNSDCLHIEGNQNVCDQSNNMCVQCLENQDCVFKPELSQCDVNICYECLDTQDCLDPTASRCENNQCYKCLSNGHCSHLESSQQLCHQTKGCVECLETQDCMGNHPSFCHQNSCIECPENCTSCSIEGEEPRDYIFNCTECEVGYSLVGQEEEEDFFLCMDVCGDGIRPDLCFNKNNKCCDDGNSLAGDGCSNECLVEQHWTCFNGNTTSPDDCYQILSIQFSQSTEEPQIFYLDLNISVTSFEEEYPNSFEFSFSGNDIPPFELIATLEQIKSQIIIKIVPDETINSESVELNVTNITNLYRGQKVFSNYTILSIHISPLIVTPQKVVEAAEQVSTVAEVTTTAALASSAPLIFLGGDPGPFLNQLSLLQVLLSFVFLNVRYPENFQVFLNIFKIGTMSFIPNPFKWIFPESFENTDIVTDEKFYKNEFTGSFLKNSGNYFLIFGVLTLIHFASLALKKMFKTGIMNTIVTFINEKFGFQLLFGIFVSTSLVLLTSLILQLFNPNFNDAFNGLSSSIAIITAILFFISTAYVIRAHFNLKKASKKSVLTNLLKRYEVFFKGFIRGKEDLPKPFLAVILFRKIIQVFLIVMLYDYPPFQIGSQVLLSLIFLITLVTLKPYAYKSEQIINAIVEGLLILIYVFVSLFYFVYKDAEIDNLAMIAQGWTCIGLCLLIVLLFQVNIAIIIYKELKGKFCKKNRKRRGALKNQNLNGAKKITGKRTKALQTGLPLMALQNLENAKASTTENNPVINLDNEKEVRPAKAQPKPKKFVKKILEQSDPEKKEEASKMTKQAKQIEKEEEKNAKIEQSKQSKLMDQQEKYNENYNQKKTWIDKLAEKKLAPKVERRKKLMILKARSEHSGTFNVKNMIQSVKDLGIRKEVQTEDFIKNMQG